MFPPFGEMSFRVEEKIQKIRGPKLGTSLEKSFGWFGIAVARTSLVRLQFKSAPQSSFRSLRNWKGARSGGGRGTAYRFRVRGNIQKDQMLYFKLIPWYDIIGIIVQNKIWKLNSSIYFFKFIIPCTQFLYLLKYNYSNYTTSFSFLLIENIILNLLYSIFYY